MEKSLKSDDDKEFMRMAMLKHEETFRQQVNELHRLYRIQKMLMGSAGLTQQQQQKQPQERYNNLVESSKPAFTIDHYQQQLIVQQARVQAQIQRDRSNTDINDKSKIMGLNLMRPDNNNQVRGPRSSGTREHIAESNDNDKMSSLDESEVELTLSLGPSSFNPRRQKMGKSESGQSISSSSTGSSQSKKTNTMADNRMITWSSFPQGSGIEPGFSSAQQNNNPPWLYQALSLKLT